MEQVTATVQPLSSTTLASLHSLAQAAPTASNRLSYALALGSAGHAGSDPVEARRLVSELLNSTHDLKPAEVSLAHVLSREFEARAALRASIDQVRLEYAQQLKNASADDNRRIAALGAENGRLRKALAEAERKLSAVAEIERSLLETASPTTETPAPPPQ